MIIKFLKRNFSPRMIETPTSLSPEIIRPRPSELLRDANERRYDLDHMGARMELMKSIQTHNVVEFRAKYKQLGQNYFQQKAGKQREEGLKLVH